MAREYVGGFATEPNFLIDTAAINRKYAARADNPYRTWTGATTVPYDCTGETLKKMLYDASGRFLEAMDKKNWTLVSKLRIRDNGFSRDGVTGLPMMDKVEYVIVGIFKYVHSTEMIRTELPPEMVLNHPQATNDLKKIQASL